MNKAINGLNHAYKLLASVVDGSEEHTEDDLYLIIEEALGFVAESKGIIEGEN